jgi:hypothetical protein
VPSAPINRLKNQQCPLTEPKFKIKANFSALFKYNEPYSEHAYDISLREFYTYDEKNIKRG